jgi:hypothetical protein
MANPMNRNAILVGSGFWPPRERNYAYLVAALCLFFR